MPVLVSFNKHTKIGDNIAMILRLLFRILFSACIVTSLSGCVGKVSIVLKNPTKNKVVLPTFNMSGNILDLHFDDALIAGDRAFLDSSSSGIIASCLAASCPSIVTSAQGKYLHFEPGQFIDLPDPDNLLNQAMNELTISAWVRNGSGHLLERGVWDNEDGFGLIFYDPNIAFGHWFGNLVWTYNLPIATPFPTDGAWHLYVGTMYPVGDGTTRWDIYVDKNAPATAIDNRIITATGAPTMIGRRYSEARYFVGDVANLMVWNRALSAAEISSLYDMQKGVLNY